MSELKDNNLKYKTFAIEKTNLNSQAGVHSGLNNSNLRFYPWQVYV